MSGSQNYLYFQGWPGRNNLSVDEHEIRVEFCSDAQQRVYCGLVLHYLTTKYQVLVGYKGKTSLTRAPSTRLWHMQRGSSVDDIRTTRKHSILFHHPAVIFALLVRAVAALGRVATHIWVVLVVAFAAYPMLLHIRRRATGFRLNLGLGLRGDLLVMLFAVRPTVCQYCFPHLVDQDLLTCSLFRASRCRYAGEKGLW
jgi:hypothetical protein